MSSARVVLIASIAAAVALTSCSSAKHATSATTTTPPTPSTASSTSPTTSPTAATAATAVRIVRFTGPRPPVTCNAPTSIEIDFETRNAKSVTLSINGGGVFATYTDGAHEELVPLTCAGSPQKYVLSAHGANGATVSKTLTIEPRMLATS